VPAAGAGQRGHVGVHQRTHHLQAGADREGEQPLAHVGGDLVHRHVHRGWHRQLERVVGVGILDLVLLGHGGPLLEVVSWSTPNTYRKVGVRRGTATQVPRNLGVCPVSERGHFDGDLI